MTKVEKKIPVVSPELAKVFELNKNEETFYPFETCCEDNYPDDIPEHDCLTTYEFEKLLIDMYSLGYEVKKPKLYYIRLNIEKTKLTNPTEIFAYLNVFTKAEKSFLNTKGQGENIKTQFTEKEKDEFLKDEPKDMWIVEEVDDDE